MTFKSILIFCLLTLCLACANKELKESDPVIVPLERLTNEPAKADFVSIDDATYKELIGNLEKTGIVDSTLLDAPYGIVITPSLQDDGRYWIHPPRPPFSHQLQVEASVLDNELLFRFKCPFRHALDCACLEDPSKCFEKPVPAEKFPPYIACKSNFQVGSRGISCKPLLCQNGNNISACTTYFFIGQSPFGFPIVVIECRC